MDKDEKDLLKCSGVPVTQHGRRTVRYETVLKNPIPGVVRKEDTLEGFRQVYGRGAEAVGQAATETARNKYGNAKSS
jgi:hypothetical protein